MAGDTERIGYLDGLRGFGALQVVLLHLATLLVPALIVATPGSSDFVKFIRNSPLSFVYDGATAVFIFFLLSGFVLTSAYRQPRAPLATLMLARLVRLAIPSVAACLLAFAFACVFQFLDYSDTFHDAYLSGVAASVAAVSRDLVDTVFAGYGNSSILSQFAATRDLVGNPGQALSPPLWTISIELQGSVLIMLLCAAERWIGGRVVFLGLIALLLVLVGRHYYGCFVLGFLLNRFRPAIARGDRGCVAGWMLVALGATLGFTGRQWAFHTFGTVSSINVGLRPQSDVSLQLMVGAALVFYGVLTLRPLQRMFESAPFVFLGKYSFALYLCHFPIVRYVALYISRLPAGTHREPEQYLGCAAVVGLAASIAGAMLFRRLDLEGIKAAAWIIRTRRAPLVAAPVN